MAGHRVALCQTILLVLVEFVNVGASELASADTLGEQNIELMISAVLYDVRAGKDRVVSSLTLLSGSRKKAQMPTSPAQVPQTNPV